MSCQKMFYLPETVARHRLQGETEFKIPMGGYVPRGRSRSRSPRPLEQTIPERRVVSVPTHTSQSGPAAETSRSGPVVEHDDVLVSESHNSQHTSIPHVFMCFVAMKPQTTKKLGFYRVPQSPMCFYMFCGYPGLKRLKQLVKKLGVL